MSDFSNMFGSSRNSSSSNWMSTTDLMSGLMIVFMFIAIAYMVFIDRKTEKTYEIVKEWNRSKIIVIPKRTSTNLSWLLRCPKSRTWIFPKNSNNQTSHNNKKMSSSSVRMSQARSHPHCYS